MIALETDGVNTENNEALKCSSCVNSSETTCASEKQQVPSTIETVAKTNAATDITLA